MDNALFCSCQIELGMFCFVFRSVVVVPATCINGQLKKKDPSGGVIQHTDTSYRTL
jgi:hypothetical protein